MRLTQIRDGGVLVGYKGNGYTVARCRHNTRELDGDLVWYECFADNGEWAFTTCKLWRVKAYIDKEKGACAIKRAGRI